MPIKTVKRSGVIKNSDSLTIPETMTIILSPEECLRILKTANDVIKNNPINVDRIINVMHMAGEASKRGLYPADIIVSDLVKRKNYNKENI